MCLVYFITDLLDIVSIGRTNSIWAVMFYFGFAGWNAYSIVDLKISNVGLVDTEESFWGLVRF